MSRHTHVSEKSEKELQCEEPVDPMITATVHDELILIPDLVLADTIPTADTCGDVIFLKNGSKLKVKILEELSGKVKCKPCNNLNGAVRVIPFRDIKSITYQNGEKKIIEKQPLPTVDENGKVPETDPMEELYAEKAVKFGRAGFLLFLLAFGFLFLAMSIKGGAIYGVLAILTLVVIFFLGIAAIRNGKAALNIDPHPKYDKTVRHKAKRGIGMGMFLSILTGVIVILSALIAFLISNITYTI